MAEKRRLNEEEEAERNVSMRLAIYSRQISLELEFKRGFLIIFQKPPIWRKILNSKQIQFFHQVKSDHQFFFHLLLFHHHHHYHYHDGSAKNVSHAYTSAMPFYATHQIIIALRELAAN